MNTSVSSPSLVSLGLQGRVAIVTGAAQGIGAACARRFAREGAPVVLADVDDARGQALASELGGVYQHCDVGDKAQVDALVEATLARHGRIDVLVNNAGIFKAADFLEVSEADFDTVLRVNLKGSFLVGQAVTLALFFIAGKCCFGDSPVTGQLFGREFFLHLHGRFALHATAIGIGDMAGFCIGAAHYLRLCQATRDSQRQP